MLHHIIAINERFNFNIFFEHFVHRAHLIAILFFERDERLRLLLEKTVFKRQQTDQNEQHAGDNTEYYFKAMINIILNGLLPSIKTSALFFILPQCHEQISIL